MSDKTILQDLESIRNKLRMLHDETSECEYFCDIEDDINEILGDVQAMINQCIEIQLHMMKEENKKNFYKKKDL
jgi:adenylate cyclase